MKRPFDDSRKIAVLDFGGQYAHLIASRIRRLGAYSEILEPASARPEYIKNHYKGIIYSGGPSSVYLPDAPKADPGLLELGLPVLGICYGHQLITESLGGGVRHSPSREYGPAKLWIERPEGIFFGEAAVPALPSKDLQNLQTNSSKAGAAFSEQPSSHAPSQKGFGVWMSHADEVEQLPAGFVPLARTEDCRYAAVGDLKRNIYGLQFHPEVRHTERGDIYLKNFIKLCGLENTWDLESFLKQELALIQKSVGKKKVFLLCSGGVDSTVAFALLSRALPEDHLQGLLIDTGFMRYKEAAQVLAALRAQGIGLSVVDAGDRYFESLKGVYDPEKKRAIIGQLFVDVQADAIRDMGLASEDWFFGQGTIYPDTIESGSTRHSSKIKTHHNRVEAIDRMIQEGRVVEPLSHLYKDEVRRLGRLLGLPEELVDRHPFPGPGLAVRCLCVESPQSLPETEAVQKARLELENPYSSLYEETGLSNVVARLLPIQSVGVQGDSRSYARALALFSVDGREVSWQEGTELARKIPNRYPAINRVLWCMGSRTGGGPDVLQLRFPVDLSKNRIALLQQADKIVHDFQVEYNLYGSIWQFPVVLAPIGIGDRPENESVILRPIVSTDAMTASAFEIPRNLLGILKDRLLANGRLDYIFYDLTSKPPGTIEWE